MYVDVHKMDGQTVSMIDTTQPRPNVAIIHVGDDFDYKFDELLSSIGMPINASLKFARTQVGNVLEIPELLSEKIRNLAMLEDKDAMEMQDWLNSDQAIRVSHNTDYGSRGWFKIEKV